MSKELKQKIAKDSIPQELIDRIAETTKQVLETIERKHLKMYTEVVEK